MRTRPTHQVTPKSFTALVVATLALVVAQAQTPSVIPNHTVYLAGEDIQVAFANGPGNRLDWIGIYPEGIVPGSTPSTIWYYVDNTQQGTTGLKEGGVTFGGGLNLAGVWTAHLLENDGYTTLAQTNFTVVDPGAPLARTDQRRYVTGQTISVSFTNGPGNAKDWIGVYAEGVTPGASETLFAWLYVDGTEAGNVALTGGSVRFAAGLDTPGNYVVYLFANDGYDPVPGASEPFQVVAASTDKPRVLSVQPAANATNLPPILPYTARITNGTARVATSTIQLQVDGAPASPAVTPVDGLVTVAYTNTALYAPSSTHTYRLTFSDDGTPAGRYTNEITVTVAPYRNIVLPTPLHFENFDTTPEDSLPAGWTHKTYTEVLNTESDLGNLDSFSYSKWTVVNADRFQGSFVTYSNPDNDEAWETDYQRVLSLNPLVVKDGEVYGRPLAEGRFAFGNSGYRLGVSQVIYLYTPDWDVTGKTNIHLAFHSLWEQNQDSFAAIEYSIDQGQNWLPIAYFLEQADVLYMTNGTTGEVSIDALNTLNTEYDDVAHYTDEFGADQGGHYGAFVAARPITEALAAFIQPRVNDDPVESKRIELFRLPQADNQSKVRIRFAHAGADSWYFGIDNVGLYAMPSDLPAPTLTLARTDNQITITWPAGSGLVLQSAPSLSSPTWNPVAGVTGNSHTVTPTGPAQFFRLGP